MKNVETLRFYVILRSLTTQLLGLLWPLVTRLQLGGGQLLGPLGPGSIFGPCLCAQHPVAPIAAVSQAHPMHAAIVAVSKDPVLAPY